MTLIFGELVPKRIGQLYPEPVARMTAPLMIWLAFIAKPLVATLSWTTFAILRLLGINSQKASSVTQEELGHYNTLAGLILFLKGQLAQVGDQFVCSGWIFEVASLDGRRIETVRAKPERKAQDARA